MQNILSRLLDNLERRQQSLLDQLLRVQAVRSPGYKTEITRLEGEMWGTQHGIKLARKACAEVANNTQSRARCLRALSTFNRTA